MYDFGVTQTQPINRNMGIVWKGKIKYDVIYFFCPTDEVIPNAKRNGTFLIMDYTYITVSGDEL